ncbi:glycosyltransferase family 1 protein, partial [Candidatus Parcubacteria bacterium]
MRILVLIHEFPPLGGGGGQAAQDIGEGLSERGHEVKVLTAHMRGLPRSTHRRGVDVIRVPSLRREAYRAGFLTMAAYIAAGLWEGYRLIRRWRPDVLHAHFAVPAGALAWMLSKLSGVPYVLTAHLGDVPGGVPEKTDRWFKWILPFTFPIWRDAKKVTAVSEYTRQLALQHYRREIMVIPNGIDLERLRAKEIRLHTPRRIVFAGRFMPQKNPRQVVEVLARIKDLPWECVMLGDGPLMPQVREAIARHGLEGRFILPGWVTPEEVLQWFDRSDILFMPSLSEGLPVVGVQALAKGLAIVASRVGGFVDLVRDGENGF